MGFPRKYLSTLHYLAPACQTPVRCWTPICYICYMHFFSFFFLLSLAKQLIRKIKSLKNILDKDASTDCTVKDIRSANTCAPHSAGCLYLPLNDLLHKLLEFWKSTSHISIFLFGIDLTMKGCNLFNKQYLHSSYSFFLVSKNILSFRAVSTYLSFLLSPATGNIAECCW